MSDLNFKTENTWLCHGQIYSNPNLHPVRNGVLTAKEGMPIFVDADTKEKIHVMDMPLAEHMVACKGLHAGDDVSTPVAGYKYQVTEGGKWGFISPRLVQMTPPVYDEIVACDSMVAAWTEMDDGTVDLTFSVQAEDTESGMTDTWLVQNGPTFCKVDKLYIPLHNAVLESRRLDDGSTAWLYLPGKGTPFGLFLKCRNSQSGQAHAVCYQKGFVSGEDFEDAIPAKKLTLAKCLELDAGKHSGLQVFTCVVEPTHSGVGVYIIRKDGYWALADVDVNGEPTVLHLATPLAYTKMEQPEGWPQHWVLLERFGKQGIYHWMWEEFVASCEYEKIFRDGNEYVLVRHGKERRLSAGGKWIQTDETNCPACGAETVRNARYCHMCGASLPD